MKNIVILGAGPCGLSAAWKLSQEGNKVTIIEKESQVGGLCRTVSHKGFHFDLGGHRFISKNTNLINEISELMGNNLLIAERKSTIQFKGKMYRYPLSMKDIFMKMSLAILMKSFADYLKISFSRKQAAQPEASLEEWLLNRFGKTLFNIFFQSYTQKLWGISAKRISANWAVKRIPVLKFNDILRELVGREKRKHEAYAKHFYYPKKGIGQIFEFMAEEVLQKKGKIDLNAKATGVFIENGMVKGITFLKNGHTENLDCDYLISTIPLPELASITKSNNGYRLKDNNELSFRSVRFLNILIDKPKISENTWIYIPDKKYLMTRIQEPKTRSPHNAPKDKTSLILEIPCTFRDNIWNMGDKEIFDRSINDLACLGIDIRDEVIDYFSTRIEHGYPVYLLGYEKHTSSVLKYLSQYKNLVTIGRQGLFRYIFMDQAMLMGISTAKKIINNVTDCKSATIGK